MKKLMLFVVSSLMVAHINALETEKRIAATGLAAGVVIPAACLVYNMNKSVIKNVESTALVSMCVALTSGCLAFFNFKMKFIKHEDGDALELFLASFATSSALVGLLLSDLRKYLNDPLFECML